MKGTSMDYRLGRREFIVAGAAALSCGCDFTDQQRLDIALINCRVWTGERGARTDAIGIAGGRIAALGADAVRSVTGASTRIIDLEGAFVMPAFIDCHTHFLLGSNTLQQADLLSVKSKQEFIDRIGAAAKKLPPGQWLTGGAWDEQRWGGDLPDKSWVDGVTGDTPIAIPRTDLHSRFLNSAALKLAGIDRNTPDIDGGVIVRDATGEPTGILKDKAYKPVIDIIPPLTDAMIDARIKGGIAHALSKGVAQVHNTEVDWTVQDAVRRLRLLGPTDLRFYSMVPMADWERMAALIAEEGHGDDWVRWGAVKCVSDGSLGARTARFYEPYVDAPDERGVWRVPVETMREWIPAVDAAGLNMSVHAIGDEANDTVLNIFADTARKNGARDRRFRIEHAQHLAPNAWKKMAQQNVIASVQPYHAADDGRWAVQRIGEERLNRTYAFQSLLDAGVSTCFGSDWPGLTHRSVPSHLLDSAGWRAAIMPSRPQCKAA